MPAGSGYGVVPMGDVFELRVSFDIANKFFAGDRVHLEIGVANSYELGEGLDAVAESFAKVASIFQMAGELEHEGATRPKGASDLFEIGFAVTGTNVLKDDV